MLKWFANNNKYLLAAFMVLLMIAFLIQPVLDIFRPSGQNQVIGETRDGGTITIGTLQQAEMSMIVLSRLNPVIGIMVGGQQQGSREDNLRWALTLQDAERMGLSASADEVFQTLGALGFTTSNEDGETVIDEMAIRRQFENTGISGITIDFVRTVIQQWLVTEQYRRLVSGTAFVAPESELVTPALQRLAQFRQLLVEQQQGASTSQLLARLAIATGTPRVSESMLRYIINQVGSRVEGQAVLINADRYLVDIDPESISDEKLQELFDQYKDNLTGTSEPYGYGYKYPDRVTIEYLDFNLTQALNHVRPEVETDFAAALDYYNKNKSDFRESRGVDSFDMSAPVEAPRQLTFEEAQPRIFERLARQEAETLIQRMIREAQSIIRQSEQRLTQDMGYYQIPGEFEPIDFQEVADAISEKYGIGPEVRSSNGLMSVDETSILPGIGTSAVVNSPRLIFPLYVLSLRELEPDPNEPATQAFLPLWLQKHIVSQPLESTAGSKFMFRINGVAREAAPETLDEVREQVLADAVQLASYEALKAETEAYLQIAGAADVSQLATDLGLQVIPLQMPRRIDGAPFGRPGLVATPIPQIGVEEVFVDAVHDQAAGLETIGDLTALPKTDRVGAVNLDGLKAIVVYQVDRYQPISEDQYELQVSSPMLVNTITQSIVSGEVNPMSLDALIERTGYVGDDENNEDNQDNQDDKDEDLDKTEADADVETSEEDQSKDQNETAEA